jgi:hypothetical protein
MIVEKYIIIGLKYPTPYITDIIKQNYYENNLIDSVSVNKDNMNKIFIDEFSNVFNTKIEAMKRLEEIYFNVGEVKYWSILPILVDVPLNEARYLKLNRLIKRIK